ncbi:MAG: hypothetical protein DWP97_07825 [Calditrichaeota bacterium]|nr:MAG: hypothetical protein DWP97_07825 [Calditrichota bacterium]
MEKEKNISTQYSQLSDSTVKTLLESLKKRIIEHQEEISKLEKAIQELSGMNKTINPRPKKRRLPVGMPKKLVLKILQKYDDLTIGEIRNKILTEENVNIRDGSARRVLKQLIEERKVSRDEHSGAYTYLSNNRDKDDDLPF